MSSSEKPGRPAAGLRVLVVEDEIIVALLLEEMLMELGHTVVGPVARLDIAVEMAQGEAFDVAILDVNLEGKEAFPVADAIGARGIPYVFATGYGNHGLRAPYRKLKGNCRENRAIRDKARRTIDCLWRRRR
jgi:CheY-like chemotaxis protein